LSFNFTELLPYNKFYFFYLSQKETYNEKNFYLVNLTNCVNNALTLNRWILLYYSFIHSFFSHLIYKYIIYIYWHVDKLLSSKMFTQQQSKGYGAYFSRLCVCSHMRVFTVTCQIPLSLSNSCGPKETLYTSVHISFPLDKFML